MTANEASKVAEYVLGHALQNKLSTNRHMLKIFNRVHKYSGLLKYFDDHDLKKTTYYKYKSAYQFGSAIYIRKYLEAAEKIKQENPDQARKYIRKALNLAQEIIELNPDYIKKHRLQSPLKEDSVKPYNHDKVSGKRKFLNRLPEGWMGMLIDELPIQHQEPAMLMALTGCRPAELGKGILLEVIDDDYLKVTIKGAKYKEGLQGQKERTLNIHAWHAHRLFNLAYEEPVEVTINTESFRKAVRRTADKLGFKGVSPYCFRHQFSANMKAELGDRWTHEDLAKALGHITDRCQQYYGHPNQKRGKGSGILAVEASGPVKKNRGAFPGQGSSLQNRPG